MRVVNKARSSATTIENQMPSRRKKIGRINKRDSWYTSVLINEIAAETGPLLSAVKKEDEKIQKPDIKKDSENIRNPLAVIKRSSGEYPTKIRARGSAKISPTDNITPPDTNSIRVLFFRMLLSSEVLFAP